MNLEIMKFTIFGKKSQKRNFSELEIDTKTREEEKNWGKRVGNTTSPAANNVVVGNRPPAYV